MEVDEPNASAVTSHSKRLKIEPTPLSDADLTERRCWNATGTKQSKSASQVFGKDQNGKGNETQLKLSSPGLKRIVNFSNALQ